MGKKFYWKATSSDGWEDKSSKCFNTEKECYEDMRNAVFEKMKWNTVYDEDLAEYDFVDYVVRFSKKGIKHTSYSGEYIYEIKEVSYGDLVKPTEEQKAAIKEMYAALEKVQNLGVHLVERHDGALLAFNGNHVKEWCTEYSEGKDEVKISTKDLFYAGPSFYEVMAYGSCISVVFK